MAEFDRLYENSGETNPMRKNTGVSLFDKDSQSIYQHTQFPTSYWYPQDERGIVDRSVINPIHWLVCGDGASGGPCNGVRTQSAANHELHAVRCCVELNTGCSGWTPSQCYERVSFAEVS